MSRQRQSQFRNRNTTRSHLLEDFRSHRYPNLQLNEIVSHTVEFARDHDGSKFIQRKLDDATENRKDAIFREMRPHLVSLTMDAFANFVVQKFFDVGNESQKHEIVALLRNGFVQFSLNKYACRVVQKAIEKSTVMQQISIFGDVSQDQILRLFVDSNGNHVIQKFFTCTFFDIQEFLFRQIRGRIYELCMNLYGCRVIQCILKKGALAHRMEIFNEIFPHSMDLVTHRYGNYVMQNTILHCPPYQQMRLITLILTEMHVLSQHKYSSNVIEKCLTVGVQVTPHILLDTFQKICALNAHDLKILCMDAFANYVMQKMIELMAPWMAIDLYQKLRPFFVEMKRTVCGRKIIDMLIERQ
ncbi:pumilio homolog 2-like [Contarinia nasturtii]|uniref:pumilio homolog 2-like n=1 Tax=Contarinia nasturtii TaxID=265458 RepID=UPI0012D43D5E|nr:pumilio homolog 2-like [Contarinia nasturtii]